jgi:PilZ domain
VQTDLDAPKASETFPDRRAHPRYRLSVPLTIHSTDGASIPGISIEISQSGISAITAQALTLDDTVELDQIVGERVRARVRRRVGRIYGFEFLNLTAEHTRRIAERCKTLPRYQGNMLAGLL